MMVVSVAFYGMATFEGPAMSVKAVNALSQLHQLDHRPCHSGAPGLGRLYQLRAIYCLVPWLWKKKLYSNALVEWHFWLSTLGIVLYITSCGSPASCRA
jgi:cytochrome c oxidase cbb3-type subunit 1